MTDNRQAERVTQAELEQLRLYAEPQWSGPASLLQLGLHELLADHARLTEENARLREALEKISAWGESLPGNRWLMDIVQDLARAALKRACKAISTWWGPAKGKRRSRMKEAK